MNEMPSPGSVHTPLGACSHTAKVPAGSDWLIVKDLAAPDACVEIEMLAIEREITASPEIAPAFVARASRCRGGKAHGPRERMRAAEGVADTSANALSKRLEGVRLATASRLASAAERW